MVWFVALHCLSLNSSIKTAKSATKQKEATDFSFKESLVNLVLLQHLLKLNNVAEINDVAVRFSVLVLSKNVL